MRPQRFLARCRQYNHTLYPLQVEEVKLMATLTCICLEMMDLSVLILGISIVLMLFVAIWATLVPSIAFVSDIFKVSATF